MFVLDRPNPIGGRVVVGTGARRGVRSFIAYHALPVRHGMTVGELALLYNAERKIGASLEVITLPRLVARRSLRPHRAGLDQPVAQHAQPDRGAALSRRRPAGSDQPGDRPGHGYAVRAGGSALDRPGAVRGRAQRRRRSRRRGSSRSTSRPRERQYAGQRCGGVQILVTNWSEFDPLRLGITLAVQLRSHYPKDWQPDGLLRLLCDRATYRDILAGKPVDAIIAGWNAELAEFQKVRVAILALLSVPCDLGAEFWADFRAPRSRACRQERWVRARVVRSIVVLDPGAKPLGRVGELIGLEPGGVFVERLVQMLGAAERNVAKLDRKGSLGLLGGSPRAQHEVERRSQPGAVSSRFAVDQTEDRSIACRMSIKHQELAPSRPPRCAQAASRKRPQPYSRAVRTSASYHQSAGLPPRRLRIDLR